jgi:hypothetical protein
VAGTFVAVRFARLVELVRHAEPDTMGQGSEDSLKFADGGGDQQVNDLVEDCFDHDAVQLPRGSSVGGSRTAENCGVGLIREPLAPVEGGPRSVNLLLVTHDAPR